MGAVIGRGWVPRTPEFVADEPMTATPQPYTPASVPDEIAADVRTGFDTDGDTRPDTILTEHGDELRAHTDLDGDGFADQVLGIGSDGTVRYLAAPETFADPAGLGLWE